MPAASVAISDAARFLHTVLCSLILNKYRIKFFGGLQIPNPPLFKPENSTQDIVSERNKKDYFRFCSSGRLRKSCCSIPIPNPTPSERKKNLTVCFTVSER
ncbi:hypothetical protein L1887_38717 [Cichorium endivia]|nr:hypothetical protein L1887_38717 [Cichorium endivia]